MNRYLKRFLRGLAATLVAAAAAYGAQQLTGEPVLDAFFGVGASAVIAGFLISLDKWIRDHLSP